MATEIVVTCKQGNEPRLFLAYCSLHTGPVKFFNTAGTVKQPTRKSHDFHHTLPDSPRLQDFFRDGPCFRCSMLTMNRVSWSLPSCR